MPDATDYTEALLAAGRANPWIREAVDPPFTRRSLEHCASIEALVAWVFEITWCLGQGFVFGDVAVMNQIDGGHEWLVCVRGRPVESFSHRRPEDFLAALLREREA